MRKSFVRHKTIRLQAFASLLAVVLTVACILPQPLTPGPLSAATPPSSPQPLSPNPLSAATPPSSPQPLTPSPLSAATPPSSPLPLSSPYPLTPLPYPLTINAPYLDVEDAAGMRMGQMAVTWFGQVDDNQNAADVRVGYNDQALTVHLAIFDHHLWYDVFPFFTDLGGQDAVRLYLDSGQGPYRFTAQLNNWEGRAAYQSAERFNREGWGAGWQRVSLRFVSDTVWRGKQPNEDGPAGEGNDRGWTAQFRLPFKTLGLAGPPPEGAVWRMALALHDRDTSAVDALPVTWWPAGAAPDDPGTWGRLRFGLPAPTPVNGAPDGTLTIRNGLEGATVLDGAVGGTTGNLCPGDNDFIWNEWGYRSYPQAESFNIQNSGDVATWPCFSRYYISFPLAGLPAGTEIVSATLELHQVGNDDPSRAGGSLLQVSLVGADWDPATLSWNAAPPPLENVSSAWVEPLPEPHKPPGTLRSIDVSLALQRTLDLAYAQKGAGAQVPARLRLAIYTADSGSLGGKFFVASASKQRWALARPTLRIAWRRP